MGMCPPDCAQSVDRLEAVARRAAESIANGKRSFSVIWYQTPLRAAELFRFRLRKSCRRQAAGVQFIQALQMSCTQQSVVSSSTCNTTVLYSALFLVTPTS